VLCKATPSPVNHYRNNMAYQNPYITVRPLPKFDAPVGPADLNSYLTKFYGSASDPLNLKSGVSTPDFDWGGAAMAGLTGLSLATDAFGMSNQPLGIETQAPNLEYSATGKPVYTAGAFYNQANSAQPQGATAGEVIGSVGKGVLAGAEFGPVGAAVGGAVGLATSLIGGGRRAKRQREQRYKATASARKAQTNYNTASEAFDQTQVAQADYLKRMNNTNRLYNLYA